MTCINDLIKTVQEHYATTSFSIALNREILESAKEHSALAPSQTLEQTAAHIARATKSFYTLNADTLILRKRP